MTTVNETPEEEAPEIEPSPRIKTASSIREMLPEWNIISESREADAISKKTVLLWTGEARRLEFINLSHVKWTIEAWLTVPNSGANAAKFEESLDLALLEFLGAVEALDDITWESATRGALEGVIDGYRIPLTLTYQFLNPSIEESD